MNWPEHHNDDFTVDVKHQLHLFLKSREDEVSLTLKVIPGKLFLDMVPSTPANNVTISVARMFSSRMKSSVKLCCKVARPGRVRKLVSNR